MKNSEKIKYSVPATRGIQSGREIYTFMMRLKDVAKMVSRSDGHEDISTTLKRQRAVSKSRVTKLRNYILNNQRDYVLPSITVEFDGDVEFVPMGGKFNSGDFMGHLEFPVETLIFPNDGQHRREALVQIYESCQEVLKKPKLEPASRREAQGILEFMDESIPVMAFTMGGIARSQQRFADINGNSSKPSTSLNQTFDHRDLACEIARHVSTEVLVKGGESLIEFEKNSVPKGSSKIFAFAAIKKSCDYLNEAWKPSRDSKAGRKRTTESIEEFFRALVKVMPEWKLSGIEKNQSLACNAVVIEAICMAASQSDDWKKILPCIKSINFDRKQKVWQEIGVIIEGRIIKSSASVYAIQNYISRLARGVK